MNDFRQSADPDGVQGRREVSAPEIFDEAVLDRLPTGVIVVDAEGYVLKYNSFEERLSGHRRDTVLGRHFFREVAVCTDVPQIAGEFARKIDSDRLAADVEYAFALPFLPEPRQVRLLLQSFRIRDEPYGVILVEDVTERRRLESQREQLLRVLVHDLRNPLLAIVGYADMLRDPSPEAESDKMIRAIETSAHRMNERLERTLAEYSGEMRSRGQVNLHALVLTAINNVLPESKRREVTLHYRGKVQRAEFPSEAVPVSGFIDQLDSMTQNLLDNAVKYAARRIEVDLTPCDDGSVVLTVSDDGPGVAPEHRQRVFEQGWQAPGSLPGTGVGLHAVAQAVANHGGKVTIGEGRGGGAVFRVELPGTKV